MSRVVVTGAQEVVRAIAKFKDATLKGTIDANNITAQAIRGRAIRAIQSSPATGAEYQVGAGIKKTHTASSPGNAPRTNTGRLASSIKVESASKIQNFARVGVEAGVKYGFWLEFGTKHIAPRPFMIPAFNVEFPKHKDRIASMIKRAMPR